MNYRILSEQTGKFKEKQLKKEGGAMSRAVEEWKKEIREEAVKTQNIRTAKTLIGLNKLSDEDIAMSTFLSLDEVKGLRQEIS